MARILRTRKYRQQAATRRSIRAHANVWSGLALDFPGFNRQFSTANVG